MKGDTQHDAESACAADPCEPQKYKDEVGKTTVHRRSVRSFLHIHGSMTNDVLQNTFEVAENCIIFGA